MFFEGLPEVKTCCGCASLKWGTVIIGAFYLLSSLSVNKFEADVICYSGVSKEKCPFKIAWTYTAHVLVFIYFMVFMPSAFLILAVFIKNRFLVTCFLHCICVTMTLVSIIESTVLIVSAVMPNCSILDTTDLVICVIQIPVLVALCYYYLVVVKSFRSTLEITTDIYRMRRRRPVVLNAKSGEATTTDSEEPKPEDSKKAGMDDNKGLSIT